MRMTGGRVGAWHRQAAAGAEILLHVNHHEYVRAVYSVLRHRHLSWSAR